MAQAQAHDQSALSERAQRYLERSRTGDQRNMPRQIEGHLQRITATFQKRFDLDPRSSEGALIKKLTQLKPLPLEQEIEAARAWVEDRNPDGRDALLMSFLPRMVRILLKTRSRGERWLDILHDSVIEILGIIDRMTEFDYEHLGSQVGFCTMHCRVYDALKMERPLSGPRTIDARRAASRILSRERDKILAGDVSFADLDRSGRLALVPPADMHRLHDFLMGETLADIPDEPVPARNDAVEAAHDASKIAAILDEVLDARACDIMRKRWLTDDPLEADDLAAAWKITPERVRQIERQSLSDLRLHLEGKETTAQIAQRRAVVAAERERDRILARRTPKIRYVKGVDLTLMRPRLGRILSDGAREVIMRRYFIGDRPTPYAQVARDMSLDVATVRKLEAEAFSIFKDTSEQLAMQEKKGPRLKTPPKTKGATRTKTKVATRQGSQGLVQTLRQNPAIRCRLK